MAKLIPLDEAAAMMGISAEELNELRSRKEIFGYRDGPSWKFKEEEVNRLVSKLIADRGGEPSVAGEEEDDLAELVDLSDSGNDVVLTDAGSDIDLSDEDSDLTLAPAEDESDLSLAPMDEEINTTSDSDFSLAPENDDDSSELNLADEDDVELNLADSSSENEFTLSDDSLELEALSDEELDLGPSEEQDADAASELTIDSSSDVDFDLDDISDSSASDLDALELSEDDMITLGEVGGSEETTQLQSDNDFLLTPAEESGADDSESGSQVIELDESFEDSAEPLVTEVGEEAFLEEVTDEEAAEHPATASVATAAPVSGSESEYSVWNVMGLVLVALVLAPTGVMMLDLVRNMWSWEEPYAINSTIMDAVLSIFDG